MEYLSVVHIGARPHASNDQLTLGIHFCVVLVAEVGLFVLLSPSGILILLPVLGLASRRQKLPTTVPSDKRRRLSVYERTPALEIALNFSNRGSLDVSSSSRCSPGFTAVCIV